MLESVEQNVSEAPPVAGIPVAQLVEGELRWLPIERLYESPWNPRQYFPEVALQELVESMKSSGYREWLPLMVRPMAIEEGLEQFGQNYEIGAGHRRRRAAEIAGIKEIPCIVREMSDEQFLDVLNFDNTGREDVHPLHEAAGWQHWMEKTGNGVQDIASKIGQSREYVYQRLKYSALIDDAKKAFLDGVITAGHAILIARLQPTDQVNVLKFALTPTYKGVRPSVRELADFIQRDIHLAMGLACFDLADPALVAAAGSCDVCPKRTKNSPDRLIDIVLHVEKTSAPISSKPSTSAIAGWWTDRMRSARTADDGRTLLSQYEQAVHDLQVEIGQKPTVGNVEPNYFRGFSTVNAAEWKTVIKAAGALNPEKAKLLDELVSDGRAMYDAPWRALLVKEQEDRDFNSTDECTDPACFNVKVSAHLVQIQAQYQEQGIKLLKISSSPLAKKGCDYGRANFATISDKAENGLAPGIWMDGPNIGRLVYARLFEHKTQTTLASSLSKASPTHSTGSEISAAQRKADAERVAGLANRANEARDRENAKRQAKQALEKSIRRAILDAIISTRAVNGLTRADVEALLCDYLHNAEISEEFERFFGEQFGRPMPRADLDKLISKLSDADIYRMAVLLPLLDELDDFRLDQKPELLLAAAKRHKVDPQKIRIQVEAEAKKKAGMPPAAKKKAPAKKKSTMPPAKKKAAGSGKKAK